VDRAAADDSLVKESLVGKGRLFAREQGRAQSVADGTQMTETNFDEALEWPLGASMVGRPDVTEESR
jgi:hypothetical protein